MSLSAQHAPKEIVLNDCEQIQYLIGNPPSWMMRYGISVMTGVFFMLLALSYFVHYPDIIEARVVLTTANPPIRVMAKSGGRVSELLVVDRQQVEKDQVLAVMDNTARWRDVHSLESWLAGFGGQAKTLPADLNLGELQSAYSTFSQHWKDLNYFVQHNGVVERIGYLQQQITALEKIGDNLQKQMTTTREEFALATNAYRRQQYLHHDKVISDKEFETTEGQFLGHKRQYENAEAVVLQSQMQIRQLESQINDLRQGKSDSRNEKELALTEDMQRLRSAIAEWKQTFLVTAPIGGFVSFSKIWSAQQTVDAGEEVLAIVPNSGKSESMNQIIGKATIPGTNSGKIAQGQRTIIRLDGFPAQQYGIVETTVASISLLPQKDEKEAAYLLDLYLPGSLVTSYGKTIPFRQEMAGHARIVTEERRVLERIFGSLRDLLQNR